MKNDNAAANILPTLQKQGLSREDVVPANRSMAPRSLKG